MFPAPLAPAVLFNWALGPSMWDLCCDYSLLSLSLTPLPVPPQPRCTVYWKGRVTQRERDTAEKVFHLLLHFQMAAVAGGWVGLKPEA